MIDSRTPYSNRLRSWLSILLALSVLVFLPTATNAQENTRNQIPQLSMPMKKLLAILANRHILIEGEGFHNIKLGDSMANIIKLWGNPLSIERTGLLNTNVSMVYKTDAITYVVFEGSNNLKRITALGDLGSRVHTRLGAHFGMKVKDIARLYKKYESIVRRGRVEFTDLSTRFWFTNDRLSKITVYD